MATLFDDWFKPDAYLEYPKGGSESIVKALLNGIYSFGGKLQLNSKVSQIIIKRNKAIGIELKNGEKIFADHIVSNADIWNTLDLIPKDISQKWREERSMTPKCKSFLHVHLGFNAEGLENIPLHSIWVDDWAKGITAERNVVVLSIPSALDPTMSPPNKHILHGYTPANEPWEKWENLKIGTKEYEKTKEERCSVFWQPIKNLIPDIQERIEIKMLGTPLTHQRFLNTKNGSYGPALSAAEGLFPGNKTPIKNLLLCGSSTFPGIGIPPVAASGAMAANTILGSKFQRNLIEEFKEQYILQKFPLKPENIAAGTVSCTGNTYCGFALTNTKDQALKISHELDKELDLKDELKIHWTGCPNSCGQAYMGGIGLTGKKAKDKEGKTVEAYDISIGGSQGPNYKLGELIKKSVPQDELKDVLKDLLISNFDAKEKIFLSKKSGSLSRFMNWFSPLGKDKPLINRANGSPDIFSKFMNRISN